MKKVSQTPPRQELEHFLGDIQRLYEDMLENWLPTNFRLATGTVRGGWRSNTHATLEDRILRHIMTKAEAAGEVYEGAYNLYTEEANSGEALFFPGVARKFRVAIQRHQLFHKN